MIFASSRAAAASDKPTRFRILRSTQTNPLASFDSESKATRPIPLGPITRVRVDTPPLTVPRRRPRSQWPGVISAIFVGAIVGFLYAWYVSPR